MHLTKSNRHDGCLNRALAVAHDETVIYIEVPSQCPPALYSFDTATEFWAWLMSSHHDYQCRTFSPSEWQEYQDELTDEGWEPSAITRKIDHGLNLFASGATSIALVRQGDREDLLPDCDAQALLWRYAHRDLHCGYLLTVTEAQKLIHKAPAAPPSFRTTTKSRFSCSWRDISSAKSATRTSSIAPICQSHDFRRRPCPGDGPRRTTICLGGVIRNSRSNWVCHINHPAVQLGAVEFVLPRVMDAGCGMILGT